jgi:hypothetical protein
MPNPMNAVGIDVVGLDAHVGAVPYRALDHGVHLGGRALQELAVNRHRPGGVDCPVDQDAPFCPAVAGVPFGEDILVEGRKVGGVGGYRSSALAPQPRVAGGEGGVRDRAGGIPARLDGDVAAADVVQVVFAVRVVARRDRPDPGVGAVGVDQQQQPLEQHGRVEVLPAAKRGEGVQAAGAQRCLGEHVQQRHDAPAVLDGRLEPAQVHRFGAAASGVKMIAPPVRRSLISSQSRCGSAPLRAVSSASISSRSSLVNLRAFSGLRSLW